MLEVQLARAQAVAPGCVTYDPSTFSLKFVGSEGMTRPIAVVNQLELSVNAMGELSSIDGWCPKASWSIAEVPRPNSNIGRLILRSDLEPGELYDASNFSDWPVTYDKTCQLLHLSDSQELAIDFAVEVFRDVIIGIRGAEISALWMKVHPDSLLK